MTVSGAVIKNKIQLGHLRDTFWQHRSLLMMRFPYCLYQTIIPITALSATVGGDTLARGVCNPGIWFALVESVHQQADTVSLEN